MTTIEKPTAATEQAEDTTTPATPAELHTVVPVPLDPDRAALLRAELAADPDARPTIKINPHHVVIGANVRDLKSAMASLTTEYVEDVRGRGFVQLPSAFLRPDGLVQLIDGQRRILGARRAGLESVPVALEPEPEGSEDEQRAAILVDQVRANVHREELTPEQIYAAQEELIGLELPARVKSKRLRDLGVKDRKVAAAMQTLTTSGEARKVAAAGQMNLLHAAQAVEFEDDPRAFAVLKAASRVGSARFVAALEEEREDRRVKALRTEEAARYAARGFDVFEYRPHESLYKDAMPMDQLRTASGKELIKADIAPSRWAVYIRHHEVVVLEATREEINRHTVDVRTYNDPDQEAREGYHHARDVRTEERLTPLYYCLDYRAAGFTRVKPATRADKAGITAAQVGKLNAEARWDTIARRAFVIEWLTTAPKALPFDALAWRTRLEAAAPEIFNETAARETAAELLGVDRRKLKDGTVFDKMTKPVQLHMISIGLGIGAIEARMQRNDKDASYWRIATHSFQSGNATLYVAYLRLLESLGYPLGIMDRVTLADLSPEDALSEIAAKKAAAEAEATANAA